MGTSTHVVWVHEARLVGYQRPPYQRARAKLAANASERSLGRHARLELFGSIPSVGSRHRGLPKDSWRPGFRSWRPVLIHFGSFSSIEGLACRRRFFGDNGYPGLDKPCATFYSFAAGPFFSNENREKTANLGFSKHCAALYYSPRGNLCRK